MARSTVYLADGDHCVAVPSGSKHFATRAALRLVVWLPGWTCVWCRLHYLANEPGCPRCNHPIGREG